MANNVISIFVCHFLSQFSHHILCSSYRNFVCYLDDEMMGGDADSNVAVDTKVCRANKFRTKPEW